MDNTFSIYITEKGDYGDSAAAYSDEVEWKVIVPTFFFTDDMWEAFDACDPSERMDLHFHFSLGSPVHDIQEEYGQCSYCHLTLEELGYELDKENDNA